MLPFFCVESVMRYIGTLVSKLMLINLLDSRLLLQLLAPLKGIYSRILFSPRCCHISSCSFRRPSYRQLFLGIHKKL